MYSASSIGSFQTVLNDFKLEGMMIRYSKFVPQAVQFLPVSGDATRKNNTIKGFLF